MPVKMSKIVAAVEALEPDEQVALLRFPRVSSMAARSGITGVDR